jgi:hypothetical protein
MIHARAKGNGRSYGRSDEKYCSTTSAIFIAGSYGRRPDRNEVADGLDAQIIKDAVPVFSRGEKMQLTYSVQNTHRAVGA